MKYGLWEDGKRIEWIEPEQAEKIMKGQYDYRGSFKKPESAISSADFFRYNFNRPTNFDHRIAQIKA